MSISQKKEKAPLKPTRKARNELTEEQKQEIKEAFDLFDTDGVGLNYS
jgi:Ca2+-binding EF-hand superfamily protein